MIDRPPNIAAALRRSAALYGERIAFQTLDRSVDFIELERLCRAVAGILLKCDLSRDASIALLARGIDFATLYFAIACTGRRIIPVDPTFKATQVERLLQLSGAELIICDEDARETLSQSSMAARCVSAQQLLRDARTTPAGDIQDPDPDAELCVIFSSGSTGLPKGVILTHSAALARAELVASIYSPGQRHLVMTPLPYAYGMINGLICPATFGGTGLLLEEYNPFALRAAVLELKPSLIMGIPAFFRHATLARTAFLEGVAPDCRFYSAGELLPVAVQRAFADRYGQRIRQSYGLSETSSVAADLHCDEPREGCVGRVLRDVEIQLVPSNSHKPRDGEQTGEIWIRRSERFLKKYLGGTEDAGGRFTGEYYRTGDLGTLDSDGFLHIHGRNDEFVFVSGVRVHPSEIERVLCAIDGVDEAAFVCHRAPDTGTERTRAYVVLAPDSTLSVAEIRSRMQGELPQSRWPQHIEISAGLPRTRTGKINRRLLVEEFNGQLAAPPPARRPPGSGSRDPASVLSSGNAGA